MSSYQARKHKETKFCPVKGCKYTSKVPVIIAEKINNTNSVHSTMCPVHRKALVSGKDHGKQKA